jgi:hypothetical protein
MADINPRAFDQDPSSSYLKRVSSSLRYQLNKPLTVYNPTFESMNPSHTAPVDGSDVEGGGRRESQRDASTTAPSGDRPLRTSSYSFVPAAPSSSSAVPSLSSGPSARGRPPIAPPPPAASASSSFTTIPQHAGPAPPPPAASGASLAPPRRQSSSGKGTRSGPYEGYASGAWLEVEMRAQADDLALAVDEHASKRASTKAELEKADLERKVAQVRDTHCCDMFAS